MLVSTYLTDLGVQPFLSSQHLAAHANRQKLFQHIEGTFAYKPQVCDGPRKFLLGFGVVLLPRDHKVTANEKLK